MILDLHNIPEDFDWQKAYFELNDKHHISLLREIDLKKTAQTLYTALKRWADLAGDKAPESDLAALKSFDSLMLEMANSTVQ
jgi:hypothetical protein